MSDMKKSGSTGGGEGGSWLSRILHGKAPYIAAAVVVLAAAGLLLAKDSGGDISDTAGALVKTTTVASGAPVVTTATGITAAPAAAAAAVATPEGSAGVIPPGGDESGRGGAQQGAVTPPPAPAPVPPQAIPAVTILSGFASPNPAYEKSDVTYTAVIGGSAVTVSFKLVPNVKSMAPISVIMARVSSGGGEETWQATSHIGPFTAADYALTIQATGAQGQSDSRSAGTLSVLGGIG